MEEAKRSCTYREFRGWQAFAQIDGPWGPERGDLQAAIIAWTVASAHAGKGRKPKLADFLPQFDRTKKRQTWQEQKARMNAIAANAKYGKQ